MISGCLFKVGFDFQPYDAEEVEVGTHFANNKEQGAEFSEVLCQNV